jgi:hypothetical protein
MIFPNRKEQYRVEVSHGFTAMECFGSEIEIKSASDTSKENIKLSVKESLDHCELNQLNDRGYRIQVK